MGYAIAGALVRLAPANPESKIWIPFVRSSLDGAFRFEPVPVGRYFVIAGKTGFVEDTGSENVTSVYVKAGESTSGVLVPLTPLGSIKGTVTGENDSPVTGVRVRALMLDPTFTPPRLELAKASAVTDRAGHYLLSQLAGGAYFVLALPEPHRARPTDDGYQVVPTFFPKAFCPEDASHVFVQPGQEIHADISLYAALTHRLGGRITDLPPSSTRDDLRLEIAPSGERHIVVLRSRINIRADRTFLADGVPNGRYEITLSSQHEGRDILLSKDEVEVGSSDVTDVAMTPMQWITVTGSVRRDNGNWRPIGPVGFRLVPADEGTSYAQPVGPDGVIRMAGIEPNRYLLQAFPSQPGSYVWSLELNHHDVLNKYVDLSQYPVAQVSVILRSGTGIISGRAGQSVGMVVLSPQSPSPDGSNIQHQIVQNDGAFVFRNVPPGDYFLYAAEESNLKLWSQPAFLDALNDVATCVHLDENGNQHVQLLEGIRRSVLRVRAMEAGFYFE
ncbi:MAG TPA: carboxypeptidase-like regulatory domain-containing protein [Bryobacteraceae bacterium]|nr:carboxypeptidase-like regulatory domain-containing protein [Bryobacteraceae bacterium]